MKNTYICCLEGACTQRHQAALSTTPRPYTAPHIWGHMGGPPTPDGVLTPPLDPAEKQKGRVHYNTIRPHSALGYRPPAPEIIVPGEELPMNHEAA